MDELEKLLSRLVTKAAEKARLVIDRGLSEWDIPVKYEIHVSVSTAINTFSHSIVLDMGDDGD